MSTANLTIAQRLAAAATRHGMWAKDVARFDDILEEADIVPQEVDDATIEEAHRIGVAQIRKIQDMLDEHNARVKKCVDEPVLEVELDGRKAPKRKATGKRAKIFGFAATAVLRWMGKHNWSFEDAAIAVETLGSKRIADATIRAALGHGRRGQRGEPADLSSKQIKALIAASK